VVWSLHEFYGTGREVRDLFGLSVDSK